MKRPVVLVPAPVTGLAAVLLWAGLFAGCTPKTAPEPPPLVVRYALALPFLPGQAGAKPNYIAVLRGDEETDLSFKVGGIVELIGREGDGADWPEGVEVPQGELLARLKQADFVNAFNSAKARAELTRKVFERGVELLKGNVLSKQEFDIMQADQNTAEANLAQREQDLRDSLLRAPYPGTILARLVHAGEIAAPGRTVLRFASLARMSVELGVPDKVVGRIRVGQEIPLVISSLEGQPVVGRVSEVGVAAKEAGRLFKVVLKVNNESRRLKAGMTASVSFEENAAAKPDAVLVPLSALVAKAGGELFVYRVGDDGKAHACPVATDEIVRSEVVVTHGVRPNDKVVVVGVGHLFDGAPVKAVPAESL